ncbi:MAG: hypothetical protein JL56_10295 [Desulfotomaculum sp. BICA1-6]|nr:MAG: hypothetical protein JL56_10295 [Desulfotomaculum sp. BICA1-6]
MKDEFEKLNSDLGKRLREFPDVQADTVFKDKLRSKLLAGHTRKSKRGRYRGFSLFIRLGSVAAVLVVMLAGWLAFFNPEKDSNRPNVGPLFMAQAQASNTPVPQITLGSGLDGLRQVQFKMQGDMPAGLEEGNVYRYKNEEMTAQKAMELARRLGISNAELVEDGSNIPENRHIYITGQNADLTVWPFQGSWYYFGHPDGATGGGQLTVSEMENAALEWLKAAGLLPQDDFNVEHTMQEPQAADVVLTEIVLTLPEAPNGLALTGYIPEIRVTVTSGGKVTQANGTWYSEEQAIKMPFADYNEALEALRRGEGVFEAPSYRHYQTGTAMIQRVQTAYQLAYAIDYTPYLVPVAVFSGEYKPAGEPEGQFTALVPLLKNYVRPNSGNFALQTKLPVVDSALTSVVERGVAASRSEIPHLAAFFNIKGQPLEDGSIRDANAEISPTSWDGGWLYRANINAQIQDNRISEDKALEIATGLVQQIPVLPGEPGTPVIRDDGSGFSLVVFPLLYSGVAITSSDPPGFASYIAVQLGPEGDVWSVNCFRPMQAAPEEKPLLTPEQAWDKLLVNKSQIHVEGFFGSMPGDRFVADSSSVTAVELAYIPRHPEMMRNDNYDLVYVFTGQAQVGERLVNFTAYVDAVKESS